LHRSISSDFASTHAMSSLASRSSVMTSLELSTNPATIADVQLLLDKLGAELKLSEDTYGNILVAATEAVNNAIKHGNQFDPEKTVRFTYGQHEDELVIEVKDQGQGFDMTNLPDPTDPENLLRDGGRGIYLIQCLSDEVRFSDNGSRIEMRFRLN